METEQKYRVLNKWNYATRTYDPYSVPVEWKIILVTNDMSLPVNCVQCGKEMTFGDGYTSKEVHTQHGLGYHVCEPCYELEMGRDKESRNG